MLHRIPRLAQTQLRSQAAGKRPRWARRLTAGKQAISVRRHRRMDARQCRRGDRNKMLFAAVHESATGPKQTLAFALHMSAFGCKADIGWCTAKCRNKGETHRGGAAAQWHQPRFPACN